MKKTIVFLLFLLPIFLQALEKPYFSYADVHAMGGYPMVGVGLRTKKGLHGADFSGNVMPLNGLSPTMFHIRGIYLFYPGQRGLYMGAGLGLLNEPETLKHVSGSMEGVLGYQWGKKTPLFLEVNVIAPFEEPQGAARVWPGLTFGLGF